MKTNITKSVLVAVAALCASTSFALDKNLEDLRIYINPGHGGFESGDRHMGTVKHGAATYKDTAAFYETNTNLWKGLATVQLLRDYGLKFDETLNPFPEDFKGYVNPNGIQTNGDEKFLYGAARDMSQGIVMSHVKNGYSRNINEIAREVEANNFDLFLSIHSNAASEGSTANYPGMFIRGENKKESVPGSLDFALKCWPYAFGNTHSQWSNYSMTNPAYYYDIDFWSGDYATTDHGNGNIVKGYYAVLRHNVAGYLMEGYFHTYQPARHRAMNPDVCRIEGEAYAHGIADYFGLQKESTGSIYGIIRDKHEKFKHAFYSAPSNSPDAYLPVNNATVRLKDAAGNVVSTYVTDDEYNGAFVFRKLNPGTYYIEVEAEGYMPADEMYLGPFEVKAVDVLYPEVWIENENYETPAAESADYMDPVTSAAFRLGDSYKFNQAVLDRELEQLEGKTVRRMVVKDNYIYVMAKENSDKPDAEKQPYVYILDPVTLDVVSEVSTAGMEGTYGRMGDIQVSKDGELIASAVQLNFSDPGQLEGDEVMGVLNVYTWDKDEKGLPTGDPKILFTTGACGNYYRGVTGFTFAFTGNAANGTFYMPSYSTYYDRKLRLNIIDIVDGQVASSIHNSTFQNYLNMDALGDDVTFTLSPANASDIIINSSKRNPMIYNVQADEITDCSVNYAGREGYFRFAGHGLMATADVDAQGNHNGITLRDITAGLPKAADVQVVNGTMDALATGSFAAGGRPVVTFDNDDNIIAADIDLYTIRDNKVTRLTTKGITQDAVAGIYAYDLKSEKTGEFTYDLTFSLTGDANAYVELTPRGEGETYRFASQAFNKGENTFTANITEREGSFNWNVVVENPVVPAVAKIFDGGFASSGVAFDRNPDSDLFGNMYVSCYDSPRAVFGYKADLTQLENSPFMSNAAGSYWDTSVGASPWRLAVMPTGKLIITDWGDKQGGMYLFDPANPENERSNLFAGTVTPSSGEWHYDGKVIGGSTSTVQVVGSGEDTKLISFQEDWPSDYSLNLVEYPIGTKELIDFEPTQTDAYKKITPYLINGNVDLCIHEKGWVFGQVRGSGNNTPGVPVFMFTDAEGNQLFNSGADMGELGGGVGLIALSDDASTFVFQDEGTTLHVCEVTWEPEFSLKELYNFNVLATGGSSQNSFQAAFDQAGNLYVANRSSVRGFTLPRDAKLVTTPAKSADILVGGKSAVEGITVIEDNADAPVRYYNLQGVEMNGSNLAPGVYVRTQGNTATKVVIR